ncbi:MAG TPA: VWA domain-containing protein [Planctomycetota bacterium]|nr:VWA domain-containing protein [Planctomycetota bacterium]
MAARWASDLLRLPEVVFAARERVWLLLPLLLALLLPLLLRRAHGALPALVLRAVALAALLALLLEPGIRERGRAEGSLVVLADVSPSVGEPGRAREEAYLAGAASPFDLVPFGATPLARFEPDLRQETDIARALRFAGARGDDPKRIVLVSDGRATRPGAEQAALLLRARGAEIYAYAVPEEGGAGGPEIRAEAIEAPPRSERATPFTLRARVSASAPCRASATLYVDGVPVRTLDDVAIDGGLTWIPFEDVALEAGRHEMQVALAGDASPEDDVAGAEIEVPGIPRVLVLAARKRESPVAKALETQGMTVEVAAATDATDLAAFDAVVILPDAPAKDLEDRVPALFEAVGKAGKGLLAIGGNEGKGLARLSGTPAAVLLPLAFEPRAQRPKETPPDSKPERKPRIEIKEEEKEAFPITLCLVIDRSGSMEESFKLRQAKAAAIAAAQALTKEDRVAILSFGNRADLVLPPTGARDDEAVRRAVGSLVSEGNTMMFQALELAYAVMHEETTPIRHVVLITDGRSSDDGKWRDLLATMTREGITLSTVGIGFDVDSPMLATLAKWGQGRPMLALPHEVPQVVTQDTQRIVTARGERGKDAERAPPDEKPEEPEPEPPTREPPPPPPPPPPAALAIVPEPGAPLDMLKGFEEDELPKVAAPEEGKLRFAAWVAARAGDEGPPLLAYFRLGLGTAAVLTVDPESPVETGLRGSRELPRLLAQLLRSVLPDASPEPFVIQRATDGDALSLRVLGEDGRPRTDVQVEASAGGQPLALIRRADRYEATLPPRDGPMRVEVRAGEFGRTATRAFVVPCATSPELARTGPDRDALLRLVGAPDRLDAKAADALRRPESEVSRLRPLPFPFLLLAAILLPVDAWLRRRIRRRSR